MIYVAFFEKQIYKGMAIAMAIAMAKVKLKI
jgi:hypothetical protein